MTVPARIYSRVLVILDGSEAAECAVRYATDIASKHEAELILLHLNKLGVQRGSTHSDPDTLPRVQVQKRLAELREQVRIDGVRVRDEMIESRDLSEAVHKFIEAETISLLVMSTQGKTGMVRWVFGTQFEQVLDKLPVPLMLVRPLYGKIVVPLDGSKRSERALPRAIEIARLHNAELILLHVYQSSTGSYSDQWALAGHQQIADQPLDQMREQLISLRNRLRQEGLQARVHVVQSNNPAQAICEFAESEEGISMIVMSTHGRTGIARWLLGSVAQQVVKNLRCPVTLVQPDVN
ncbi:MAG: universal stress protein [Anaerolineae bacterium]|nr:universal stress protein [Anaerolineae bacterium]